ncbi:MAG: cytochrome b/b6 domain-containing protein [Thermodesulfobacteriota bacterium]
MKAVRAPQLLCIVAGLTLVAAGVCRAEDPFLTTEECLACHGKEDLKSRRGISRYIDPARYRASVHGTQVEGCTSCHAGITEIDRQARIPHPAPPDPNCSQCHPRVFEEYSRSLHAQVSKKLCYSCHSPHYSVSFRSLSGADRKAICLKCHDAWKTHRWLPQMNLHFDYLECTSCHALNAEIGIIFSLVEGSEGSQEHILDYRRLVRFVEPGKKALAETLDRDANGRVSDEELQAFMNHVKEQGMSEAALQARILVFKPSHNLSARGEQTRNCLLCHSTGAPFYSKLLLKLPEEDGGFRTVPLEKGFLARRGQRPFMEDVYLLGESKIRKEDLDEVLSILRKIGFKWIDVLGAFIAVFSLCAVGFHAMLIFLTRKARGSSPRSLTIEPLPWPVRVWHWVHGLCVIVLVFTGIQLRLPDVFPIFASFLNAVNLHNLCGLVVAADFVFWLLYHLVKREFSERFLVSPVGFFRDVTETLHYYGYVIFAGGNYPKTSTRYDPFDPVERIFYLTLMLVLVPIQIVTGLMLYDVHTMQPAIIALGGLRSVDAIHLLVAYLIISSMILHCYFHTLKKYGRLAA